MTGSTAMKQGSDQAGVDTSQAAAVFYDGACPICRREIAVYKSMAARSGAGALAHDTAWLDVSDDRTPPPDGFDRETLLARFHVRRVDGSVASGAAAFLAVWRATPRLAWLGRALDRQPFLALGDGLYWVFLKLRRLWRR